MMNHRKDSILGLAALVGLGCSAAALAVSGVTPPPPTSTGQDVVVSGIGASASATAPFGDNGSNVATFNGAVGGIAAYSLGTTSCNIGNTDAIWFPDVASHPVIGGEIYRYSAVSGGRMEMIGMNWLKHGFCAADATSCAQLVSPNGTAGGGATCNWLGRFQTDTYSASLNGAQNNMGRRSEVNPWTGVYPYPGNNYTTTGNAVYKRLQVKQSDINATDTYFGESVYITTDEPGRNKYNNYSHRKMSSLSPTASGSFGSNATQAYLPALYAWKTIDPAVTIVAVDPNGTGDAATDGRFLVAYKVTQLDASTWHYEYAVMNMNNDRCASGFSVPVSQFVSLSNDGFHDVDFHSGEPYTGTDWVFTNSGGNAAWTMVNDNGANSNALRWSTTYNFRFDCNQAPVAGNASLTMFKAGSPGSVSVAVQVPAVPPPPGPGAFNLSSPADGATGVSLTPSLSWTASANADHYDVTVATDSHLNSVIWTTTVAGTSANVPAAILANSQTYYWGVIAVNGFGTAESNPIASSFATIPPACSGDLDGDGHTGTADLTLLLGNFGQSVTPGTGGDLNGDGTVGTADLTALLGNFGC